jgi:hypothetical protein
MKGIRALNRNDPYPHARQQYAPHQTAAPRNGQYPRYEQHPQGPHPPQPRSAGHQARSYVAPPPAPQKRRRVWPWVLLGIFMAPILGFVACTAMVGGAVSAASGPATIRYELTGDGSAQAITWSQDGGTGQESSGSLPWSKTIEFKDAFLAPVTLAGQLKGDGSITCKITNTTTGVVIAESTSSGQFAVVSCMGTANER